MTTPGVIDAAANRAPGPGRTVWLASYPKSGNTWLRAIVTGLQTHRHLFAINRLRSGAQPFHLESALPALGLDVRWLTREQTDPVRDTLVRRLGQETGTDQPVLRKTHEIYRDGPLGREPFPTQATRAAILVVRDPRDVACSFGPFFGVDTDEAIEQMARVKPVMAQPARWRTAQPWGSWSSHARSWLSEDVPFPVHLVRYEDLHVDPVAVLGPVFRAVGLPCTDDDLGQAVDLARFDRLREFEASDGFRESSRAADEFFRRGISGGWRSELTGEQVAAVESDHAATMRLLGYEPDSADATLDAVREVRQSRRRQELTSWMHLPEHLGISVSTGEVPDQLPGARHPKPWIQVTEQAAVLHFRTGAALLVRDGREVVVDWPESARIADDDPSWLVHGWAVTLAMLQRGNLSLHAATLGIGGRTVAIAGARGAGKSTTSMALRARGHQLLVDDVTLIEFHDQRAWMQPYSRNVHLLPDAAAALGLDFASMRMLAGGRRKAGFRAEDPPAELTALDHIVVLNRSAQADEVTVVKLRGADRVRALIDHTRRDGIAPLVLGPQKYFATLTELADTTGVHVITRPDTSWSLDDVVAIIEDIAAGGER